MATAGPESSSEKPLRLWPGVAVAIIVVLARFVIAPFVPGRRLDRPSVRGGRCRAHPSLVALLQPRYVGVSRNRDPLRVKQRSGDNRCCFAQT